MKYVIIATHLLLILTLVNTPAIQSEEPLPKPAHTLSKYDSSKAFPGFTIFPLHDYPEIWLLNMKGKVVHRWPVNSNRTKLLSSCNILVIHNNKKEQRFVREYNWDGEVVWEYKAFDIAHHDLQRTPYGSTIFPIKKRMKYVLPGTENSKKPAIRKLRSDHIVELSQSGEVLWYWEAEKHLDVASCGARRCANPIESERWKKVERDWTHVNTVRVLEDNRWWRAGHKAFKPGNIVVNPRNWWRALIIDRKTKQVVWSYDGDFKGGLMAPHETHLIADGLPGAGNMLIFDNGRRKRPHSVILELNPVTKKVVWFYEDPQNFYSRGAGAVQRLANGNTLISEDEKGRVFEVTKDKEIVWEFKGKPAGYRAKRYGTEYCEKLKTLPIS